LCLGFAAFVGTWAEGRLARFNSERRVEEVEDVFMQRGSRPKAEHQCVNSFGYLSIFFKKFNNNFSKE
jgi:hypothetical protein